MNINSPFRARPKPQNRLLKRRIAGTNGVIDLASIIVGVIIVGIVSTGITASVFTLVPWAQDESAKQDLTAASNAEQVGKATGTVQSYDSHQDSEYRAMETSSFSKPNQRMVIDADASEWVAGTASKTGKIYLTTSTTPETFLATDEGYNVAAAADGVAGGSRIFSLPMSLEAALPSGFTTTRVQSIVTALYSGTVYDFGTEPRPGHGGSSATASESHMAQMAELSVSSNAQGGEEAYVFFDGFATFDDSAAFVASLPNRTTEGRGDTLTPGLREAATAVSVSFDMAQIITDSGTLFGNVAYYLNAEGAVVGISVGPKLAAAPVDSSEFLSMVGSQVTIVYPEQKPIVIALGSVANYEYTYGQGSGSPATNPPDTCWSDDDYDYENHPEDEPFPDQYEVDCE